MHNTEVYIYNICVIQRYKYNICIIQRAMEGEGDFHLVSEASFFVSNSVNVVI